MRIAFVGVGRVNFGWSDDPWDHASRLEMISKEGKIDPDLSVVGIFDLNIELCKRELAKRLQSDRPEWRRKIWLNSKIYPSLAALLEESHPDAVWIGVPPAAHGPIERTCASAGVHMFIEKPISCAHPSEVEDLSDYLRYNRPELVVSVGYMLRYSKAVLFIRNFLKEKNLQPTSLLARYNTAYPSIASPMWWDKTRSGGPIIEQATHFCDLLRYLGGEYVSSSISAISVLPSDPVGKLSKIPEGVEKNVPEKHKIPRAVNAIWKFYNGAIASLSHGVLTHGQKYHTQLEIWADGYRILLNDPYSSDCSVTINNEITRFPDDDMYLAEDTIFLTAIKQKNKGLVYSTYADAVETYKLTWLITKEANYRTNKAKF